MPQVQVNGVPIHYDHQGSGEPLILIPFLAADHACFAFQLPDYAKHFSCWSVDLRGAGESGAGEGSCTMALFADDVAAFMQAMGIGRAHLLGFSLGGAVAMKFAAAYPERVMSLSLHSTWPKTDAYLGTVVESWRLLAEAVGDVHEVALKAIFPWCFTSETYVTRPDLIRTLSEFVLSRPKQKVSAFLDHLKAVLSHDVMDELRSITGPTHITFGARDELTSTRFAQPMLDAIRLSELEVFEHSSHMPFFDDVENFNARSVAFLRRHSAM